MKRKHGELIEAVMVAAGNAGAEGICVHTFCDHMNWTHSKVNLVKASASITAAVKRGGLMEAFQKVSCTVQSRKHKRFVINNKPDRMPKLPTPVELDERKEKKKDMHFNNLVVQALDDWFEHEDKKYIMSSEYSFIKGMIRKVMGD